MVRAAAAHKTTDGPPLSNRRGVGPPLYAAAEKRRIGVYGMYANSSSSCAGLTRQNVLKDLNDSQSAV